MQWNARWIWAKGRSREPFDFAYFRAGFEVQAAGPVRIHCAADSKYRMWLNGEYVGFGPARGLPECPYYDTRTVEVRKGANTIAFLVEHYTQRKERDAIGRVFAGVRAGLICQVEAATDVIAATDGTWRVLQSDAYSHLEGLILCESFDARQEPEGWELPGFDDSRWATARPVGNSKLASPEDLRPRPIPIITERRYDPAALLDVGNCRDEECSDPASDEDIATSLWRSVLTPPRDGLLGSSVEPQTEWRGAPVELWLKAKESAYLTLDFGQEMLASPELDIRGPAGIMVDLGYSECLLNNRVATRWQGQRQPERIVLRDGRTQHRITQPRGFRYMMLRVTNPGRTAARPVVIQDISAHEAIYPAVERGRFRCSDPLLDRIYRLSARTVNLCMEDAYTDCPWRERSQWLGDLQPEALFSYYCFGSYDIARKAVLEFAAGNTDEGWIPGVFPTRSASNLPTWGMRYPVIGWEYYMFTGDREALPAVYEASRKQMAWLQQFEGRDGLLVDVPDWCFVDWTALDERDNEGVLQGWYLQGLDCSARLAAECGAGKEAKDFQRRASKLRKALASAYWSPERKAFLRYRSGSSLRPRLAAPDLIGQHENFLFSRLGVGTPAMRRQALQAVAGSTGGYLPNLGDYQSYFGGRQCGTYSGERTILIGTPFWSFYALLALMDAGKVQEAVDYIRLGWGLMLDHGATSCWEMWDRHSSFCHGWSAAPAMILPAYVLGVRPTAPGFARFDVCPCTADLAWAKGAVPTPHGPIRVSWKKQGDAAGVTCEVTVPEGTRARFSLPRDKTGSGAVTVLDGQTCRTRTVTLVPGKHVVEVRAGA